MTSTTRRRFLSLLGMAPIVAAIPTKTYVFFGGIFRPTLPTICRIGDREFTNLQDAFDALPEDGVIYLKPGTIIVGQLFRVPRTFTLFGTLAADPFKDGACPAIHSCVFDVNEQKDFRGTKQ